MIGLVLGELRSRPGLWVWTLVSLAVASACITGLLVSLDTARAAAVGNAEMTEGLNVLGANVVVGTVLAAMAVVGTTTGLTLATQAREHALWLVLGVPRRSVQAVLLGQLILVGFVGWLIGLPGGAIVARLSLGQWSALGLADPALRSNLTWPPPVMALVLVLVASVAGGWGATRRAARVPEMAALRDADQPAARVGWARVLGALCLLVLAGVIFGAVFSGPLVGPEERAAGVLSADLLIVIAMLMIGGWTLRPLLWAWTAAIPVTDPAWFVAREACRTRSARSITTVLPFAMALSLLGVLLGAGNVFGAGAVSLQEVLVLIGWVLLMSWVGGVAVIALAGRERERDTALLIVAGASRAVMARAAAYEALIYAFTAVLFGAVVTIFTVLTVAEAANIPAGSALMAAPWGLLGSVAGLTLLTTGAAVAPSIVRAHTIPVTETLRA